MSGDRPFLIWSNYHRAWFRPGARGYTDDIRKAGVFTDHGIEPTRERKVYLDEADAKITAERDRLLRELAALRKIRERLASGAAAA
jgi:hypothetical protein